MFASDAAGVDDDEDVELELVPLLMSLAIGKFELTVELFDVVERIEDMRGLLRPGS
jgi:hypothetical protein